MSNEDGTAEPVPFNFVQISSPFWAERQKTVHGASLVQIYQKMKETGRWDCLKLKWKPGEPNKPHHFWDSDIAKWLEASCYSLVAYPNTTLARLVEEAVDMIRGAQQQDGYINSYYTVVEPGKRWTNLAWMHEMYCAGHLLEAALAHHAYSGSDRLLKPLLKYMQHINDRFGLEPNKKKGYPGHEEIELALVRAFEITGEIWLLDLARYFIEQRGRHRPEGHYFDVEAKERGETPRPGPGHGPPYSYHQADKPITGMTSIEGHSVRAMYWMTGATGIARLMEDKELMTAVQKLWVSTTQRKMYVTGGLGAIPEWEGFGPDYYLPNETGYLETCAAIGLVFFAHQMARISPRKMEYADVMELALHNAVLVGLSLDGKKFSYDNPLAVNDASFERKEWFNVSCCPANVSRVISSVGGLIYGMGADDTVFVHLYISSKTKLTLSNGTVIKLEQSSLGPWRGGATFTLAAVEGKANVQSSRVALCFRIPPGCEDSFKVSSNDVNANVRDLSRRHRTVVFTILHTFSSSNPAPKEPPTKISVSFKFKPQRINSHPLDLSNRGSIAISNGPFIYCAEAIDNPHIPDLRAIRFPDDAELRITVDEDSSLFPALKGGPWKPVVLKTYVRLVKTDDEDGGGEVTGPVLAGDTDVEQRVSLTMVPYFMWANRAKSGMRVWLPKVGIDGS